MKFHQVAPWDTVPLKNVFPLVPGLKGTSEPKLRRMILSYRRLRELPADFVSFIRMVQQLLEYGMAGLLQ